MTVTRRDILEDASARDKFIDGVKRLKQEVSAPRRPSTYDSFVIWHHQAMMRMTPPSQNLRNAAHVGPVFPPWHRFMLIAFERQPQRPELRAALLVLEQGWRYAANPATRVGARGR